MTGTDHRGSHMTSERARELRKLQTVHPRTLHRLKEVVAHGARRACIGSRCAKAHVCPYGSAEDLPTHCIVLDQHLRSTARALGKSGNGPVFAALLGNYLRLDELAALAAWWLSERDPFTPDEAGHLAAPVVEQYRGILREQAALLRQMGASRPALPDHGQAFARALEALPDATPRPAPAAPVPSEEGLVIPGDDQ